MTSNSHIFACFSPQFDTILAPFRASPHMLPHPARVEDSNLAHRLYKVLRLRAGQRCIFFGKQFVSHITLRELKDGYVGFDIENVHIITPLQPTINLWLAMLDRQALEDAVYTATALGAHTITLIITSKVRRTALTPLERDRLQRIMIAAAEQSKQWHIPALIELTDWQHQVPSTGCILGDQKGTPLLQHLTHLKSHRPATLIIGPEGDFTTDEKNILAQAGVTNCQLVPSVLRSQDAVVVGLGILRSIYLVSSH
jgi:16S rRNA (uracil1498-N3)-methyltransferase